jgi:hypothetical protein
MQLVSTSQHVHLYDNPVRILWKSNRNGLTLARFEICTVVDDSGLLGHLEATSGNVTALKQRYFLEGHVNSVSK